MLLRLCPQVLVTINIICAEVRMYIFEWLLLIIICYFVAHMIIFGVLLMHRVNKIQGRLLPAWDHVPSDHWFLGFVLAGAVY